MKQIKALFEDGVFRPTEPVDLPPGTRVSLELVEVRHPVTKPSKPRTPAELSKLELDILHTVYSAGTRSLERIVESLNWRREDKGLRELTRKQVLRGLRSLIDAGYVRAVPSLEGSDIYLVTPWGKVLEVHRVQALDAARLGRPEPAMPSFEDIGPFFEDLDLSLLDLLKRTRKALRVHDILTVGDVLRLGAKGLCQLRGIGKKSIEELEYHLDTMDLRLKDSKSVWATLATRR